MRYVSSSPGAPPSRPQPSAPRRAAGHVLGRQWPLLAALAAALAVLTLGACDDPSSVGADLDEDAQSGRPRIVVVEPATFSVETIDDFTLNAPLLVGRVDDPALGVTQATGYADVFQPSSFPVGFLDRPIDEATLVLEPSVTYGDTTSTVTLTVGELQEELTTELRSTDDVPPGPALATASFGATDTLMTLDLPATWLATYDAILRDTSDEGARFDEALHGFSLQAPNARTLLDLEADDLGLRLVSGEDTVRYGSGRFFSSIDRASAPLADDRVLLQDGVERALQLSLGFDETARDTLRNFVINRAELILTADTSALNGGPTGFVRPVGRTLVLEGDSSATSDTSFAIVGPRDRFGSIVPYTISLQNGRFVGADGFLLSLIENTLGPEATYDRFRLRVFAQRGNTVANTVRPLVLYGLQAEDPALRPRLLLTVTPLD